MTDAYHGPANWLAADMADPREWAVRLTDKQIGVIDSALRSAHRAGATLEALDKEAFPLPGFDGLVTDVRERLENGRGVVVLRGLPAPHYAMDDLRLIYRGLGLYFGTAVAQSARGDLVGDVTNVGGGATSSTGRGNMSNDHLDFHTDSSDVVSLMVLRTAKRGGLSMTVSSVAIRNEIAATRPDCLEVLYQPFYWNWEGQQGAGELPYYQQPLYTEFKGRFASRYIKARILSAYTDFPELPALTELQIEAMSAVDRLAADPRFHLSTTFAPGDIQFLNNHIVYHSRTAFEDFPEPDRKRHLLRMWLSVPNSRALSPAMSAVYRDRSSGAVRGGFASPRW
ncbi:TauD/TfdA family dioxygenase [Streptacidiphilus sp. P02-A3a]|uniref:TauD/TfdA family dioxygenase n=1 Tax=Streptacidiphilus sp. P02-A3a TaxID=2704468 RepID=UPI0015FDCF29|nr:TauD/TfdA family dioxygenase [Streptacidiphilus sp. P02-A3a]QMU71761.1 TauD/TfdA family dioxygenase [Streptacidiphilus sp. P02-A3a]